MEAVNGKRTAPDTEEHNPKKQKPDVEPEIPCDLLNAVTDLPVNIRVDNINEQVDLDPVPVARPSKSKPTKKAEQLIQATKTNALLAKPAKENPPPKPRARKPAKPRPSRAAGKSRAKKLVTPRSSAEPDKFFTPKSKKKKPKDPDMESLTEALRNSQCSQEEPILEEVRDRPTPSEQNTVTSSNKSICPLEDLNVDLFDKDAFMYSSSLYASDSSLGLVREKLMAQSYPANAGSTPVQLLHAQQRQHLEECFGLMIDRQQLQRAQLEESLKEL